MIVGLGNPGAEYHETRHNAGFMAVDYMAEKFSFGSFREKFDGLIAEGKIDGEKVYLLKPQTYMNLSGNSVVKAAHFYKILPQNVIVFHDDMDLPLGKIKAKNGGGSGGHNGIKSIDSAITSCYNRVRIGVGHPQGRNEEIVSFVLARFTKAEKEVLCKSLCVACDNIDVLIKKDLASYSGLLGMKLKV